MEGTLGTLETLTIADVSLNVVGSVHCPQSTVQTVISLEFIGGGRARYAVRVESITVS